jgi:hypothetical protein
MRTKPQPWDGSNWLAKAFVYVWAVMRKVFGTGPIPRLLSIRILLMSRNLEGRSTRPDVHLYQFAQVAVLGRLRGSIVGDYRSISIFADEPNRIRQVTYGRANALITRSQIRRCSGVRFAGGAATPRAAAACVALS